MNKIQYPYERDWSIDLINLNQYESLHQNWRNSQQLIKTIRKKLEQLSINPEIKTVAAAGSFGRMEGCPNTSDVDLIIVLSDNINVDTRLGKKAYEKVWECIKDVNIERPKCDGVFSSATTSTQLLSLIGNAKEEKYSIFAQRLLLLLETQPVYNNQEYDNLLNSIIDRYAEGYVAQDSKKEWTFLLNDLIRYFRSITVNYQWEFINNPEKWRIRNIKLRHSRLVMYAGLLMLLGEASKERHDKVNWLKKHLTKTPLERIAWVYSRNQDYNFKRIASFYNVFLSYLNQPEVREKLKESQEKKINKNEENTYNQEINKYPDFSHLKENSEGLIAELLKFTFERRNSWSQRFFEYLIF